MLSAAFKGNPPPKTEVEKEEEVEEKERGAEIRNMEGQNP